jgi:hypothetical protein
VKKRRATIASTGILRRLDPGIQPDRTTTAEDVKDPEKLARAVQELREALAGVELPRSIDFEDLAASTGGALLRLAHGFGGRVRWFVMDWQSSGTAAPVLMRTTASDENTLVLGSYVAGTVTVRVEEAG